MAHNSVHSPHKWQSFQCEGRASMEEKGQKIQRIFVWNSRQHEPTKSDWTKAESQNKEGNGSLEGQRRARSKHGAEPVSTLKAD